METQNEEQEDKLSTQINVDQALPETTVIGLDIDAAKKLLTAEEKASDQNIKIYLDVREALEKEAEAAKPEVEKILNGAQEGLYFDLSLFKKVEGQKTKKLHEIEDSLTVTMKIPEELNNHDENFAREYLIIRVHEGEAGMMDSSYDFNDGAVSFKADRFSTYVIAYKDTQIRVPVLSLTVFADKTTLTKAGETAQLTAKIIPENATNQNVTWKSGKTSVATVDQNGKVTAVANGTVTITATTEDGNKTASVNITVKIPEDKPMKAVTSFGKLRLNSAKQTTTTVTLNWTKVANADGYIVYGSRCSTNSKTYTVQKLKTITNNSTLTWTSKNLKKATYYKYIVKAYRIVNKKQVVTDISTYIHVLTKGGKYGMAKAVSITKISGSSKATEVTLKVGKSAKISAKEIPADKKISHHRGICYESSNTKVATVSKTGVIQAKGKGTCKVWVFAQNGVYKTITVTVK